MGGNRNATVLLIALATALAPVAASIGSASLPTTNPTTSPSTGWTPVPSPAGTSGWGFGGSSQALVLSTINDGTFRSTDNGQSWQPVDAGIDEGDIAFDPTDPTRAYYGGFGGLARTTDAGATWETVIDASRSRVLTVHEDGTVAASTATADFEAEIRVSHDAGESWQTLNWPDDTSLLYGLAFGETNEDLVVMSIADTWVTNDGGDTWTHEDVGGRDLVSEPDGTLWRAGTYGLQRSTDDGQTWSSVPAPAVPKELAPRPGGGLLAATGDGVIVTDDGGASWTNMGGADAAWAATGLIADPHDPDAVLMSDEGIGVTWTGPDGEGGYAFEGRTTGLPPVETLSLATSEDASTMVAGADLGIYASTDGGSTWTHTGAGMGVAGIGTVAAGPAGEQLYAGDQNLVFQPIVLASPDGGQTFSFTILEGNDGTVTGLAVDPEDPSRAWAAANIELTNSKIYETRDGGQSWTPVLDVPVSVFDVAYDAAEETLYAGTEAGVLASPTAGDAWLPASGPFAFRALDAEAGTLYAGNDQGHAWRTLAPVPALAPWTLPGGAIEEIDVPADSEDTAWMVTADGSLAACTGSLPEASCTDRSPPGEVLDATVSPDGERVLAATASQGLWSQQGAQP